MQLNGQIIKSVKVGQTLSDKMRFHYTQIWKYLRNQNEYPARTHRIRWCMQQDIWWYRVQTDKTELNWQPKPSQQSITYSRSRFLNSLNTPGPNFSILLKCRYLGEHTNSDINTRQLSLPHTLVSATVGTKSQATLVSQCFEANLAASTCNTPF
jgi:hypothetical protein